MSYLTYEEYKEFGFADLDESEFSKLLSRASDVLDYVTSYFYKQNDFETDISFRKEQFKKALVAQIEYFDDIGATTSHEVNNPLSVRIGRTEQSVGARNQTKLNSIVSEDSLRYLSHTGLLYRGIGVRL